LVSYGFALGLAAVASGCAVNETRHGQVLPSGAAQELSGGHMTQARVVELLGTPTSVSAFDRSRWYYISEIQQFQAFFRPDVVAREVLILDFDNLQQLERVSTLSEKDGKEITLVARETPTEGNEMTIMEQLLGNLGRFNKAPD
jgi:outer membrane protein assembly factor BamE (lipoprotein component of BamABCDE complex)